MKRLFALMFVFIMVLSSVGYSFASSATIESGVATDITEDANQTTPPTDGSINTTNPSAGATNTDVTNNKVNEVLDKAGNSYYVATPGEVDSVLGSDWQEPSDLLGISESPTIDEIGDKLEMKGFQVAKLLQKIGRAICIVGFIASCIMIVVSVLGNPKLTMHGAIGCIVAGAMYMCITYGAQLVKIIANFFVI